MFRSDDQRKAMFAAMRQQQGGTPVRGSGPIRGLQARARGYYKKHPIVSEVALGVPIVAAGLYASSKIGKIGKVARFMGRRSRFGRGLTGLGIDFLTFSVADVAARRLSMGPAKQRPPSKLSSMFIGQGVAEPAVRLGVKFGAPLVQGSAGRYALLGGAAAAGAARRFRSSIARRFRPRARA